VNLPEDRKRYFMVPGVGHYGIFNGRRWRETIAPEVEAFIRSTCPNAPLHGAGRHQAHIDMDAPAGVDFA
jgi:poly(3-hydroxybutyrate) depolymerase